MNCHHCKFHRNCINGAWCTNLKAYVEHQLIENCSYYEEKTFVENHKTCAWAKGNTCRFWGCSHRELYKDIESDHDYDFFMENSKCTNFKKPKK